MGTMETLQIHVLPGLPLPEPGTVLGYLSKKRKRTDDPATAGPSGTATEASANLATDPALLLDVERVMPADRIVPDLPNPLT